jgi:hypothetical protein
VYAELGSTWFLMLRRPREAAHVLGKLLFAVGEDGVDLRAARVSNDAGREWLEAARRELSVRLA